MPFLLAQTAVAVGSRTASAAPEEFPASAPPRRWYGRAAIALLVVAGVLRAVDVWRPVDGTVWEPWREPDVAGIARNFYREGMNLLYPRIDWRGDGPGYVESEFPLFPWMGACLYRLVGYHEELLRLVAFGLGVGTCVVVFRLAGLVLPPVGALAALAVVAVNPLAVRTASAVQPESLMLLAYVLAVERFVRWLGEGRRHQFWTALAATALAISAKASAAHVGILFACLCLERFGRRSLLRPDLALFAVVALGVPGLWHWHAHHFWTEYGNSLGISNEAFRRISSLSFLEAPSSTIRGNLRSELDWVWMPSGAVLGAVGLWLSWRRRDRRFIVYWTLALGLFYIVAGRTTGESWAFYYHVVSIPPAALAIGVVAGTALAPASGAADLRMRGGEAAAVLPRAVRVSVAALLAFTLASQARQSVGQMHPAGYVPLYESATAFARYVPEGRLIVVTAPSRFDQHGLGRASDPAYFFFWMDRKGFTLPREDQTLTALEGLRRRGAAYLVAERTHLRHQPKFEAELREAYPLVAEGESALLFELTPFSTRRTAPQ